MKNKSLYRSKLLTFMTLRVNMIINMTSQTPSQEATHMIRNLAHWSQGWTLMLPEQWKVLACRWYILQTERSKSDKTCKKEMLFYVTSSASKWKMSRLVKKHTLHWKHHISLANFASEDQYVTNKEVSKYHRPHSTMRTQSHLLWPWRSVRPPQRSLQMLSAAQNWQQPQRPLCMWTFSLPNYWAWKLWPEAVWHVTKRSNKIWHHQRRAPAI